jgi:hypothetical protein
MGLIKITAENVKTTFCTTEVIADTVDTDYIRRGVEGIERTTREGDEYHLDFGGSLLGSMKAVRVGRLSFWPHQAIGVLDALKHAEDRGGYVKLHGRYSCLCIGTWETECIREEVAARMAEFERIADEQFEQWQKAVGK